MAKKNPVHYAESLGVHTVWEDASKRLATMTAAQEGLERITAETRAIRAQMADREMEIVAIERASNPDLKVTPFKEHVRAAVAGDLKSVELRTRLRDLEEAAEQHRGTIAVCRSALSVLTARMNELGGLLYFYGATVYERTHTGEPND